jgi:hypothetical protein
VYAAKEHSNPLEDWQVDTGKESIAALPGVFPEERVNSVSSAVASLL